MPGKVGRPRKNPLPDEAPFPTIGELVENPAIFEQDMRVFFQKGGAPRLQRWFIASGDPQKAELIATHMVEWFRDKLASLLPEEAPNGQN